MITVLSHFFIKDRDRMEDGSVRIRTVDDELEGSGIDLEKWLEELKEAEKWIRICGANGKA